MSANNPQTNILLIKMYNNVIKLFRDSGDVLIYRWEHV